MPERSYPPVDDPARYDQIVRRGRSLRRRRQVGMGLGAGGGVAAAVLAVVLLTGTGGADQRQVVADDRDPDPVETTTTTTTTTTTPPPPDELVADVAVEGRTITIEVIDPAIPVDDASQQCVTVSMIGPTGDTAEGTGCDDTPVTDGAVVIDLRPTDGVLIGCGASQLAPNPEDRAGHETELRATTFRLQVPDALDPGDYDVDVGVTSGIGDGCAGTGDEASPGEPVAPGQTEHSVTQRLTLTLE